MNILPSVTKGIPVVKGLTITKDPGGKKKVKLVHQKSV